MRSWVERSRVGRQQFVDRGVELVGLRQPGLGLVDDVGLAMAG